MRRVSNYERPLKDILDSDDELTTDYVEPPYVPAYKDDSRFQHLIPIKSEDTKEKRIVKRIILNTKDAFCLRCMQRGSKDTCRWFIKFMLYKDLQSNYKFLQSCLIPAF